LDNGNSINNLTVAYRTVNYARVIDAVHSSSSLAKGFFPEAQSQMRNKIRTDQGIAMATI
jgi:hypothetical protein